MKLFENIANFCTKNESKIELAGGIILGITATVLACRATLKVDEVVSESKETIEKIHSLEGNGVCKDGSVYSTELAKGDISKVMVKTSVQVGKLYLPALAFGVASIGLILRSFHVMDNKIAELSSALALTENAFSRYRNNVRIKYGDDVDKELAMNKFVKKETIDEDGNVKTEIEKSVSPAGYSFIFSPETSDIFESSDEQNIAYINGMNRKFDALLQRGGKQTVTLRDIYKAFGLYDKSKDTLTDFQKKAALVCGWVTDGDVNYDQHVIFTVEKFMYDEEKGLHAYWIDLNCGKILDRV